MSTPDWRAEKSAELVKHLCQLLARAKVENAGALPDRIPVSRSDLGGLLWNATKLYCEANEDRTGQDSTWSPELPEFLQDHPEQCEETLGIVAAEDYRDPYYDGPLDQGVIRELAAPRGHVLELRNKGAAVIRGATLRELAVKLSTAGLDSEVYLGVRNAFLQLARLPAPGESVTVFLEWQLWTLPLS